MSINNLDAFHPLQLTSVSETFDLEEHDFLLLQAMCETLDRKNQAESDLRKHGSLTFTNRHDELKPHPAHRDNPRFKYSDRQIAA
jgi:phage terminase small subunit